MQSSHRTVNIAYWNFGGGMRLDVRLLEQMIREAGLVPKRIASRERTSRRERRLKYFLQWRTLWRPVAAQFHLEQIHREQFRHAHRNYILPNPDFTDPAVLPRIDRPFTILAKTRHAEGLFGPLVANCRYMGFTSPDSRREGVSKNFRAFLHLAGMSDFKGTFSVAEAWRRNPDWPQITIVRPARDRFGALRPALPTAPNIRLIDRWISDEEVLELKNACGVHLCPSEMEGFGHYIFEAMGAGSVVITTDAPPMNELVRPENGMLAPFHTEGKCFMVDKCIVSPEAIENCVRLALALPVDRLAEMGAVARTRFEEMDGQFRERMRGLLAEIAAGQSRR